MRHTLERAVLLGILLAPAGCVDQDRFTVPSTVDGTEQSTPAEPQTPTSEPDEDTEKTYEQKLREATTITIKQKPMSYAAHYNIFVGDEKVAEITGKYVTSFGDVFTLTTVDGTVLASEKEIKRRWGRSNRTAECYDADGNTTGYIGEEKFKDGFSWAYIFHFYDKAENEIGESKKRGKSAWNDHKLYDKEGNIDYTVDKKAAFADTYEITVHDSSSIPLEHALLLVTIEDMIADSN